MPHVVDFAKTSTEGGRVFSVEGGSFVSGSNMMMHDVLKKFFSWLYLANFW